MSQEYEPCNPEIFAKGVGICYMNCPMHLMEGIVREVRRGSDIPDVDWNYVGGRAVVRILHEKDREKVLATLDRVLETAREIQVVRV